MVSFISRDIKTFEISQYNRLKKGGPVLVAFPREFWLHILHFSAPFQRNPQNKDIPKFSTHKIKPIIWKIKGAVVDDLAPTTIWGAVVGDIIFDEELRGTVVGNIISSTSSFDYRSLSLFVSRERKKKVEVVPISLPLLRSTTKYSSNFGLVLVL